jgi:hypothetical protein
LTRADCDIPLINSENARRCSAVSFAVTMLWFPTMFVPALVLDDGAVIAEVITLQLHYKKIRVI